MSLFQKFLDWFTGRKHTQETEQIKKVISAESPKLNIRSVQDLRDAVQIQSFQDVKAFCEEMRKDLDIYKKTMEKWGEWQWTHKKTVDRLYVEFGNLSDKIDRLIEQEQIQQSRPVGE